MTKPYHSICADCSHAAPGLKTCEAFPKGIPAEILRGSNPHREPLENQGNDLMFEMIIGDDFIFYDSDQCFNCRNYLSELICTAFPLGIPSKIITGEVSHDRPYPGQDFDIVFEERENI